MLAPRRGASLENEEIDIDSLPVEHRILPRLIDFTYGDKVNDFGDYKFQDSLKFDNIFTPAINAAIVGKITENVVNDKIGKVLNQRRSLIRDPLGGAIRDRTQSIPFLGNLINIVRETRQEGMMDTTMGDIDSIGNYMPITFSDPFFVTRFKGAIPPGIISSLIFAGFYYKAINNIVPDATSKQAPRINYYQKGSKDVFTVRGTVGVDDLANDAITGLGGQAWSPALAKKIDMYEQYIRERSRGGAIVIAGHSLGSLETSVLSERLKDLKPETVGYGHPITTPGKDMSIAYTFENDPLYAASGASNHRIIRKEDTSTSIRDKFSKFHSPKNYY